MTVREQIRSEIEKLPENVLQEVFDFIRLLEMKNEKAMLCRSSQKLSQASFVKVWDNEEDAAYDRL